MSLPSCNFVECALRQECCGALQEQSVQEEITFLERLEPTMLFAAIVLAWVTLAFLGFRRTRLQPCIALFTLLLPFKNLATFSGRGRLLNWLVAVVVVVLASDLVSVVTAARELSTPVGLFLKLVINSWLLVPLVASARSGVEAVGPEQRR